MANVGQSVKLLKKVTQFASIRFKSTHSVKLIYSEYGDPSKVVYLEKEILESPGPGKVLVKMLASPVNPADINTLQGIYPVKPPLPTTPGGEGVGQVEEVGEGVKNLKPGDMVLPRDRTLGTWRSHMLCPSSQLSKIQSGVDVIAAATLSVNPCTAYRMLKDFVQLKEGDVIIQNGANSSCGQSVIQFCKNWGIISVNVVRNRTEIDALKSELKSMGADYVLTEEEVGTTQLFKNGLKKPKLALNCVGGKNATEMIRHLGKRGVMVTYGGMSREPVIVPTSNFIFKDITLKGFWMTRWSEENAGSSDQTVMLSDIATMSKTGKWQPPPYELVSLDNYKDVLNKAMHISGKTGRKFIFDLKNLGE
ncbi:hypothetical protein RUM43_003663 [Polyplax serrata]|uniref:Enoyl-[acyl-carrier-protein] reductase, mitochondrial n=1 Tax=Polyplax serrata TaxID=468196 RepID=A0AAN8RXE8_POLSC